MARLARAARLEPRVFCFEIAVVVRFRILLQPIVSRGGDPGRSPRSLGRRSDRAKRPRRADNAVVNSGALADGQAESRASWRSSALSE
jgi:hypothetical protein